MLRSASIRALAFGVLVAMTLSAAAARPAESAVSVYRMSQLHLRDPHTFVRVVLPCFDITDTGVFGSPSFNQLLNEAITTDGDGDGDLDLNALLIFDPLQQAAPGGDIVFHEGLCTAPMAGTTCRPDPLLPMSRTTYTNGFAGTCLTPRPGTTRPYSPAIVTPAAPCFVSAPATIALTVGGIPVLLESGQAAARYVGDPATGLVSGLLSGFLSEAAADTLIIPPEFPLIGGQPLSLLLPGGTGSCGPGNDQDLGPDGVTVGWWFYLNFTADPVPFDAATSVAASHGDTRSLRFYPPMPNPVGIRRDGASVLFAYATAQDVAIRLDIYDPFGRLIAKVAEDNATAGRHFVEWSGRDMAGREPAPGVYFAILRTANETRTQKIILE